MYIVYSSDCELCIIVYIVYSSDCELCIVVCRGLRGMGGGRRERTLRL